MLIIFIKHSLLRSVSLWLGLPSCLLALTCPHKVPVMANFIHCNFHSQRRTRLCQVGRLFHGNWQQSDFINPHFTALLIQPLSVWIWFLETRHWGHDILRNREATEMHFRGFLRSSGVCVSPRRKNLVRGKRWVRSNLLEQAAVSLRSTRSGEPHGELWATVLLDERKGVERGLPSFSFFEETSSLRHQFLLHTGAGVSLCPRGQTGVVMEQ